MNETIVLDLDGPLLDGRQRHYAVYASILERNGLTPLSLDAYWARKREGEDRRTLLGRSGGEHLYDDFLASWIAQIESPSRLALDRVQPGAMDRLQEWRSSGHRLLVVTLRRDRAALDAQLEALGLTRLLDEVVAVPHSEGAAGKAKAAAAHADRIVVWIGDTELDIAAARQLDCPVWVVTCGLRSEQFLAALGPDHLSPSLLEVDLGSL